MTSDQAYAGDISSADAWKVLSEDDTAVLVDVRTRAEWTFVGVADLRAAGKEPALVEWQQFPGMDVNPGFVDRVAEALRERNAGADSPVFFLCRSGARSRAAAIAMTASGLRAAYNISDGFEGPPDADHHRGGVAGWKAAGLPWVQS
ncbi:rhodanese-like domain-containing protein [Amorphus sp. MBR-141]